MNKIQPALVMAAIIISGIVNASIFRNEAQAACGVFWVFDDASSESVNFCSGISEDGTFSSKIENNVEGESVVTITLNNYRGKAFHTEAFGSGFNITQFTVELIGSNEITIDNFNQVYTGEITYQLTGDGQLIVKTADMSADCVNSPSDGKPVEEFTGKTTTSVGDREHIENLSSPIASPRSIWNIILWFAVRIVIFGGMIAIVVFATLGAIWLRKRKRPKTQQPKAKQRQTSQRQTKRSQTK